MEISHTSEFEITAKREVSLDRNMMAVVRGKIRGIEGFKIPKGATGNAIANYPADTEQNAFYEVLIEDQVEVLVNDKRMLADSFMIQITETQFEKDFSIN